MICIIMELKHGVKWRRVGGGGGGGEVERKIQTQTSYSQQLLL